MVFKNYMLELFKQPRDLNGPFRVASAELENADGISNILRRAYDEGELAYFRDENPELYFDSQYIKEKIDDDKWSWLVFLSGNNIAGIAVLREEVLASHVKGISPKYDGVVTHDLYLVSPEYRGHGLTANFLNLLYKDLQHMRHNYVIHDLIVLSPATKGMRHVLQKDNEGRALGIYPHKLLTKSGRTESILLVSHYPVQPDINATIIPEVLGLYNIIGSQVDLGQPNVVTRTKGYPMLIVGPAPNAIAIPKNQLLLSGHSGYKEVVVDAANPNEQKSAVDKGFVPIAILPEANAIVMADCRRKVGELDFLLQEDIEPNKKLLLRLKNIKR